MMAARAHNPAVSPEQYRMAQAVLSGTARESHMPVKVAREIVDKTPAGLRSEWSSNPVTMTRELAWAAATDAGNRNMRKHGRSKWNHEDSNVAAKEFARLWPHENPSYGMDLDLETSMAPAWMYYDSKEARDQAARVWEGQGKKIIKEQSFFGYKQAGGKKYRLRAADHLGNPSNGPNLPIYSVSITQAKEIPSPTRGFVSLKNARKEAAKVGSSFIVQVKDSNLKHVLYMAPSPSFLLQDLDALVRRGGGFRAHENPMGTKGHRAVKEFFGTDDIDIIFNASPERAMHELVQRTGKGHGVEHIDAGEFTRKAPGLASLRGIDYVNMGDPYITTLIHDGKNFVIGKWGDWIEKYQRSQKDNPGDFYQRTMHDNEYHEIGEHVTSSVYGPVQITARRETNDPEKYKYEYDITPVTKRGRTRRSMKPYGPGPGKRYRGNPAGTSEEMFESFHGEPSDETVEYTEEEHYHGNLAALGEMVELKVKLVNGDKAVIGFDAGSGESADNPFWPFNSFTKTTIYHVGTGEKYKKSGSFKGYTLYQKLDTGEFLVPALDKDSRFDTLKDAKAFINSWTKHQKNPLPASGVIGANRKSLVQKIFAGGHDAKVYTLSNGFVAEPTSMDWVKKEYGTGYKVKLRYAGAGNYNLRIHSNLWYDFKSDVVPNPESNPSVDPGFFPSGKLSFKGTEYAIERLLKTPESGNYAYLVHRPGESKKYVAWVYHWGAEYRGKVFDITDYRYFDDMMSNPKQGHGGPFREAGKLVGSITSGASRPMDDFIGAAGKVGGYLDDQIGRALNPGPWDMDREPVHVPGPVSELVQVMNENNAQHHTPYRGYEITESRKKYHLLNSILSNGQRSAVFMIDKNTLEVFKADGYGKRGRRVGTVQSIINEYKGATRGQQGPWERNPRNPDHSDTGPTLLCSNEDGTQLSFKGGDQSLDLNRLGITGSEAEKELVYVGHVTHITYHTRKQFGKKPEEFDYVHRMGEDGGEEPILNYDRINKRLLLSGGTYNIEKPLMGTSPGIER